MKNYKRLDDYREEIITDAFKQVFPKNNAYDICLVEFAPKLVSKSAVNSPSNNLREIIDNRDLKALDNEFERAISTIDSDPPSSVTAACAILESLCRIYLEDEKLPLPTKLTIKPLWASVQDSLGLKPNNKFEDDINRILSGITSIVDGIGAFRTHVGSAHGQGRNSYKISSRHARLAIHSAHTLAIFIIETWDSRKS